jgi:hypothetical protein
LTFADGKITRKKVKSRIYPCNSSSVIPIMLVGHGPSEQNCRKFTDLVSGKITGPSELNYQQQFKEKTKW